MRGMSNCQWGSVGVRAVKIYVENAQTEIEVVLSGRAVFSRVRIVLERSLRRAHLERQLSECEISQLSSAM